MLSINGNSYPNAAIAPDAEQMQKLHVDRGGLRRVPTSDGGVLLALTQLFMKLRSRIMVVGVDFSELADSAFRQASLGGIPSSGMRVYSHFRVDVPWVGITRLATELEANFVVMGSHGRHGVARWLLGSVAEGVVRHAPCPVLVIPMAAQVDVPKIEPACSMCIASRRSSQGRDLWCIQHRGHHGRRHTCHQRDRTSEDALPLVSR